MAAIQYPIHAYQRVAAMVLLIVLSAAFGVALAMRPVATSGSILPGVTIAGIPVGGLSAQEARAAVAAQAPLKVNRPVHLMWEGGSKFVLPAEIGIAADVEAMVDQAVRAGRSGNLWKQLRDRYLAVRRAYAVPLIVQADPRLDDFIDDFRRQVSRPPRNAEFVVGADDAVHIVPEKEGWVVDAEALRARLMAVVSLNDREVYVPYQVVTPHVTAATLRNLGIRRVVTRFATTFDETEVDRTHNLKIAAQAVNGAILAPGESFSFNQRVGPRVAKAGYRMAPVVVDGELVPDIGGGVCQVSTTLYNAALLAGLRIDKRQPHTRPSTYVPLGLDAAVAYSYIDFRFTNTTSNYLYIKASVENDQVLVTLLGAEPAAPARLVSQIDEIKPIPIQEVLDPTLPLGERVVEQEGGKGYSVSVWRITNQGGKEERHLVSRSTYKPRPRVLRIGVGTAGRPQVSGQDQTAAVVVAKNS